LERRLSSFGTRSRWCEAWGEKSNVSSEQLRKTFANLATIEMVSSALHASAPSQPASYVHMDQVLSKAISKRGEDTQELTGGQSNSSQETPQGVRLIPHKDSGALVSNAPQHESDTQKAANPVPSTPDFAGGIQEGALSKSAGMPAKVWSSFTIAPQAGTSPNGTVTSNSPSFEESGSEKAGLRPLVPSQGAVVAPGLEPTPAATPFDQPSRSSSAQEVPHVR
jgi:hypothetical protein